MVVVVGGVSDYYAICNPCLTVYSPPFVCTWSDTVGRLTASTGVSDHRRCDENLKKRSQKKLIVFSARGVDKWLNIPQGRNRDGNLALNISPQNTMVVRLRPPVLSTVDLMIRC